MRSIGVAELLFVSLLWLAPAVLAGIVASKRGGSYALWTLIGLVSGPLAILVLILSFEMNHHKRCSFCQKRIHVKASKCPYCQSEVVQVTEGSAS